MYLLVPVALWPNDHAGIIEHKGRSGVDCNGKCIQECGLQGVGRFSTSSAQQTASVQDEHHCPS
jgi:hypothetical protein